jgi:hypothetical protein
MARLNLQEAEPIVDKLAPAKEALNTVQKFVNQQEEAKTANVLAKARSDWNAKMNKLQQDTGLDAEGFSDKVGDMLLHEEQRYLEQIPLAQRQNFKEQFSTLKYDFLSKANIYENQALAEKMVVNVKDTINLNANSIISDYTQRDKLTYQTDAMIDRLNLPKSTADALKKESRETYVISEINALTSFSPETLLKNLNSGLYDKDIDPSKKAAAITQAKNKIKSNEVEAKRMATEQYENEFNSDMVKVVSGEYSKVDLLGLLPKYKHNMKDFNTLVNRFEQLEKDGFLINQTAINLNEGKLNASDKTDQTGIDMFYATSIESAGGDNKVSFLAKRDLINKIISKTPYIPKSFSQELRYMKNSSNYQDVVDAGVAYYEAKQINPGLVSDLSDDDADELYYIGLAKASGKQLREIVDSLRVEISDNIINTRVNSFKKYYKDGKIKGDLDVEDISASNMFEDVARFWYQRTGDLNIAKKMGEDFVNSNYENNVIGTGKAGIFEIDGGDIVLQEDGLTTKSIRAKKSPIFRGPMQEYGSLISGHSKQEKMNILAKDLLARVKSETKNWMLEPSYEKITISNDNKHFINGKPGYLVSYDGVPLISEDGDLMYWVPNISEYLHHEKEQ